MKNVFAAIREQRHARAFVLALLYSGVLFVCHWLAFQVRFDFVPKPADVGSLVSNCVWEMPVKIIFLAFFGQLYGILRYFSLPDFGKIVAALGFGCLAIYISRYFPIPLENDPRGVVLLDLVFSIGGMTFVRLAIRTLSDNPLFQELGSEPLRVCILGAGDAGAQLAREMLNRRSMGMTPVVFLDDDEDKWKLNVHGVPVMGAPELLSKAKSRFKVDKAVIAMPNATAARVRQIVGILNHIRLPHETVPSLYQLTSGQVSVTRLRPVDIEDLLGRDTVRLDDANARQLLQNKVVAVTGAGGSIGAELCRQIASYNPQRLLLIEQSEPALFQIEQQLIEMGYGGLIMPKVADILDGERMRNIFKRYHPSILFHAAAHKHVPMMEHQPGEAIKNNTFGTALLGNLALEFQLERFVLISTDKAINPTNVMGATKRMAEIYIQSLHQANPGRTRFAAVRFGNVLGSSGSVIPTFKKQIEAGGPVKVTHRDIMRYFMTIPEAVGLVLQSAVIAEGGEIFVLDMGQPVKIVDLARQMIELSGYAPDQDIKIEFTGLRPGEKLFEELSTTGENYQPTSHSKISRFVCKPPPYPHVKAFLDRLSHHVNSAHRAELKAMIKDFVPEYQPFVE